MLASCETKKQAEDENQEQETKELLGSDAEIKDNQRVYFISPEDAKQAGIAEEIENPCSDHYGKTPEEVEEAMAQEEAAMADMKSKVEDGTDYAGAGI